MANVGFAPCGQGRRHRLPPRRRPHSQGARRRSSGRRAVGYATQRMETAPRGRRNFFTRVSHEPV